MGDSRAWLDPRTQEILQPQPPDKIAPPTLPEYSLILLETGGAYQWMVRAVRRVNDCSESEARKLLTRRLPLVVNGDLSHYDALLGQFEFVCCDSISVFLASDVAAGAESFYLKGLFAKLRRSDEFRRVTLSLDSVPSNEEGGIFLDQFLGLAGAEARIQQFPIDLSVLYKKARIMAHWADRVGAKVRVTDGHQAK